MSDNRYNVNFFKPKSDHAKANSKLIIAMVLIWALGVFGFQTLQIILNKPTPEKAFINFEKIWPQINKKQALTKNEKITLAKCSLFVLGKNIAVKEVHKTILKKTLSNAVFGLLSDTQQQTYIEQVTQNPQLVSKIAAQAIELKETGLEELMINFLPYSLVPVNTEIIDNPTELYNTMKLYLVHNRNPFTQLKFLGFPFHYWYTAQFLLIMFVLLCLFYAYQIERVNKKYNFVED